MIREKQSPVKCITSVTPTICQLMQVLPPSHSNADVIQPLIQKAKVKMLSKIDKCLLYAPDAIGTHLYEKYSSLFAEVLRYAPIKVPLYSVFPPKTPVCYASMFTGAMPEVHGIREYEKPVLKCDTLFDALIRNGKKIAIAAVANSSIDLIFRNRDIDYFSEKYDAQVTNRAVQLLELDKHHFIIPYHQEYDDILHKSTPQSEQAIEAIKKHVSSFIEIAQVCERSWKNYNRLIIFGPDHGAHSDPNTGKGCHGEDIPEDMQVYHFYGLYRGADGCAGNKVTTGKTSEC